MTNTGLSATVSQCQGSFTLYFDKGYTETNNKRNRHSHPHRTEVLLDETVSVWASCFFWFQTRFYTFYTSFLQSTFPKSCICSNHSLGKATYSSLCMWKTAILMCSVFHLDSPKTKHSLHANLKSKVFYVSFFKLEREGGRRFWIVHLFLRLELTLSQRSTIKT